MFNREKFLAETMLRIKIQNMLREKRDQKLEFIRNERAKKDFRKYVNNMLREAKKSPVPYGSTGISVLADTLKKINPVIHDDFITLTTDVEQRKSFRAHIINGFKNAIAPLRTYSGDSIDDTADGFGDLGADNALLASPGMMQEAPEDEIGTEAPVSDGDIDNDGIPDAKEKFIETDPEIEKQKQDAAEVSPEDQEKDEFSVEGEDETGRNMALQTFKKVEKSITDSYTLLSNSKDRDEFYEYGIINLKLYFDRWEEELQKTIQEV